MSIQTHQAHDVTRARSARRRGFSLLELLAVMSIMALLSTLAVTSYFSSVKGMAKRSAKRHLQDSLTMARQRACIDGKRVSLIAFNEPASYEDDGTKVKDLAACYVVCKEIGRISFKSGNYLFDEYTELEKLFQVRESADSGSSSKNEGGVKLYNLNNGSWVLVKPYVVKEDIGSANAKLLYSGGQKTFESYAFVLQTGAGVASQGASNWKVGDPYGVEVSPVQSLPRGYSFSNLNPSDLTDVESVTFQPDGTVLTAASFAVKSDKAAGGDSFTFSVSTKGLIDLN